MKTLRLAIITSHPIQYYAPLFRRLAHSGAITPRVFYTWSQTEGTAVRDAEFGRTFAWDIPLLEGYDYEFIENVARRPGTDHFWGLINPHLTTAIMAWRPHAILVIGWNSWSHLRVMMQFKGRVPVLFRGDSTLLDPRPPLRRALRRALLRFVYGHVDLALAVGENNRDYFRWCGLPPERICLVPHAVDTERFAADAARHAQQAQQWRRDLGIPERARILLYAGKFIPVKDPLRLLRAFTALAPCPGAPPLHLVFVGHGELERTLMQAAAERRDVHFLPFQNQQAMPAVYRLSDVYVLPSVSETWGLAMNEAMATGSLIIASSRVGGARDVVEEGINGWTFEAGRQDALAEIINRFRILDAERLANMKSAASERSRRWSLEAAAAALTQALQRGVQTA